VASTVLEEAIMEVNRRGFLKGLLGTAAALFLPGVKLPPPDLVTEAAGPVFDLACLPLPIVHSDFWFSASGLVASRGHFMRVAELSKAMAADIENRILS